MLVMEDQTEKSVDNETATWGLEGEKEILYIYIYVHTHL